MKIVKVKILKGYTRAYSPKFVFRVGQVWDIVVSNKQVKIMKEDAGKFYKIISIKELKLK